MIDLKWRVRVFVKIVRSWIGIVCSISCLRRIFDAGCWRTIDFVEVKSAGERNGRFDERTDSFPFTMHPIAHEGSNR